jgi:DNA adenine methylase
MKTFIRWSGNKSRYLKYILPLVPTDYNRYVEPFVGSGALFLSLQPKTWLINDMNKDLINVWLTIQQSLPYIKRYLTKFSKVFIEMNSEQKKQYCSYLTSSINQMEYTAKRAVTFLLMKYCAYMGHIMVKNIYKYQGLELNLYNPKQIYFLSNSFILLLDQVNQFLNSTKGIIMNTDYKNVLKKVKAGDFVFLDPPYKEEHNYKFKYNANEVIDAAFEAELYEQVQLLDVRGVKWLMTQADTKQIKDLFKLYKITKIKVYRAASKSFKYELIIRNY